MSAIKECFVSRFPNGVLLECDFSQLEVVGLAALSRDPVLIQDLLEGRDMHRHFAAERLKKPIEEVTDAERKVTKKMTFALQYGSGANGLASKNGLTKKEAQDFIDVYYARYTRVAEWQEEVFNAVRRSRVVTGEVTPEGFPIGRGEYESETGRTYTFTEKPKPPGWRGADSSPDFNPPNIKNYPIQGYATGDVMALYRAMIYRQWVEAENRMMWLPINTVHDSVMFDCETREVAAIVTYFLEELAAQLPDEIYKRWGIESPVPFKVETKIGPNWANMEKM